MSPPRVSTLRLRLFLLFLPFAILARPVRAAADALPPPDFAPSQLAAFPWEKETVADPFPGILILVRNRSRVTDNRYHQPYHVTCCVYAAQKAAGSAEIAGYTRRFLIYGPDDDSLPTLRRAARLLLLLWGENHARFRFDHGVSDIDQAIDVWFTRQPGPGLTPDVAGEQFKNQIYLYNVLSEREPIEWAREIAHEYGHYALVPGASGFKDPEDDSNGVLGQRLFLKWIWEDLHLHRITPDGLPFITPEQLDDYIARQVLPLIRQIARSGPDARKLAGTDAAAMDYYTGFVLYLDSLYGSHILANIRADTVPGSPDRFLQAPDTLHGAAVSLAREALWTVAVPPASDTLTPDNPKSVSFFLYLPRGEFTVTPDKAIVSCKPASDTIGLRAIGVDALVAVLPGWKKITVEFESQPDAPAHLTLRRRAASLH